MLAIICLMRLSLTMEELTMRQLMKRHLLDCESFSSSTACAKSCSNLSLFWASISGCIAALIPAFTSSQDSGCFSASGMSISLRKFPSFFNCSLYSVSKSKI